MKLITAVIKPFKLEDVRQALAEAGVQGIARQIQDNSTGLPVMLDWEPRI